MYNVIDLFAGAGGLSLGFQQTGNYCIRVAFENNPTMQETYKKNFPNVDVRGDVRGANYSEIKKKYGPIDVIIGGPPCQGFSNANRQRNHAISHNNSLVKEFIRAILEIRPKAFVMENVSMLRSDVHRFYLSRKDNKLVKKGRVETKITHIPLLEYNLFFEGIEDIIKKEKNIREFLWSSSDYLELNVIFKATQNKEKLISALKKHERRLKSIATEHIEDLSTTVIKAVDRIAFSAILQYYEHKLPASDLCPLIKPAIMYQRMLSHVLEFLVNDIVVDSYLLNKNGLNAEIRSFAVLDYIKALLADEKDAGGYVIATDILNAADFGAPQKRKRFVIVGMRKDVSQEVKLPQGKLKNSSYNTVYDAISDLEDVEPFFSTVDDVGVHLKKKKNLSNLAKDLRDESLLKNHIVTKTTNVAMKRFKVLKQGENFHALDNALKTNTYTDISRTQNTIYLRLEYGQPSGTVVNVRKSMWIHPVKDRAVSVREAARLQTFPDSFVFYGTKDKQYQQVGNAVPPIMARTIAEKLANQLNECNQK